MDASSIKLFAKALIGKTKDKSNIKKGIAGELIPIPFSFLRDAVRAFELVEARGKTYQDPLDSMEYEELMELIKPPPAMPPRQGDFWEWSDSND